MSIKEDNFYDRLQGKIFKTISQELNSVNEKILDVACGDCKLVQYLAKEAKIQVVGLDIDDSKFRDVLAQGEKEIRSKITCIEGDAEKLEAFAEENFSGVVSVYALHEFDNPLQVLRQCWRVLENQGKIIIVDFLSDTLAQKLWSEKYFNLREMKELVADAGFRIKKQRIISREGPAVTVGTKKAK